MKLQINGNSSISNLVVKHIVAKNLIPYDHETCAHLQVVVSGKEVWQVDHLVSSPLRWHHYASDLFHLRIIWRTDSKEVACNLLRKKTPISEHRKYSTQIGSILRPFSTRNASKQLALLFSSTNHVHITIIVFLNANPLTSAIRITDRL